MTSRIMHRDAFKPATEATEYTPVTDETFGDIVKTKCEVEDPVITLEEVALFNWGTKEPKEIVRALVELVGVKEADDDPAKCKMDVSRGPGGGKILLPKLWKKDGLSYETIHTLKVKKSLPATAISITSLDKWFLPADETCEVAYTLEEGLHTRALKVDMRRSTRATTRRPPRPTPANSSPTPTPTSLIPRSSRSR